jgi:D-xylose transport system substrate-binding protein
MRTRIAAVLIAAALALAGCGSMPDEPAAGDGTIAFLLPESKAARYESTDRPSFEQTVAERCASCHVLYANADQDAARQLQQAESVLTQGAGVLVLGAVDATAAIAIVEMARARGVPVIAYDRFIADSPLDYFVGVDGAKVGYLQGMALVKALEAGPAPATDRFGILVVNGAATDPNAAAYKAGLARVLRGEPVEVLASHDTPDWSPDKTQAWVSDQLTQFGSRVDGIYAANDGEAGGAISAMRAAGFDPVVPVTGQDAELAAIQRIISGDQLMTIYKAVAKQAAAAAELAVQVVHGRSPVTLAKLGGVPAVFLEPQIVDIHNVRRVIVDGGIYTTEEICVEPYTQACVAAGLLEAGAP